MSKAKQVICNKAGRCEYCDECPHGKPHGVVKYEQPGLFEPKTCRGKDICNCAPDWEDTWVRCETVRS